MCTKAPEPASRDASSSRRRCPRETPSVGRGVRGKGLGFLLPFGTTTINSFYFLKLLATLSIWLKPFFVLNYRYQY